MASDVARRCAALDWGAIEQSIDERGYAWTSRVLTPTECASLRALYGDEARFRSRVDMARHRFGLGEYKYFARPLPPLVEELRSAAFPYLAEIANRWARRLGQDERYPRDLKSFIERCARHGQTKPTPLLLAYETDGFNCLHQDLYGEVAFPLQITSVLSRKDVDYTGGEFLLLEQRPRAQSRGEAIAADQGELLIFPTRHRPVAGARGAYRVSMRHGVSRVTSGKRMSLGIIFHDAR
jgi:hypothetical protein